MVDKKTIRNRIRRVPIMGDALAGALRVARRNFFPGSQMYWERHYARCGTSGNGSEGAFAQFKASVLNEFVAEKNIDSVIEFGCGDGQQLALAKYPRYLGLDVSPTVLRWTMRTFADDPAKSFLLYDPELFVDPANLITADLALSLDVIYHLVEDDVYETHLRHVFSSAHRFVVLFTSDADSLTMVERLAPHVRHRSVLRDVAGRFPKWWLRNRIPHLYPYRGANTETSFAEFFVYERCV